MSTPEYHRGSRSKHSQLLLQAWAEEAIAAKKAQSSSTPDRSITSTPSDSTSNTKTAHSMSSPTFPRAKTPSAVPNTDGIAAGKSNIIPFKLFIKPDDAPKRTLSVEVEDVRPLTRCAPVETRPAVLARPTVRVVGPSNILVGDFSRYPGYCQDPKVYAPHGYKPIPMSSPIESPISGLVAQRRNDAADSTKRSVFSSFSSHWFEDENVPLEFAWRFSSMAVFCISVRPGASNLWFDAPCPTFEAQASSAKKETPRARWWRRGFSLMKRVAGNAIGAVPLVWKTIQDSFQKLRDILVGF